MTPADDDGDGWGSVTLTDDGGACVGSSEDDDDDVIYWNNKDSWVRLIKMEKIYENISEVSPDCVRNSKLVEHIRGDLKYIYQGCNDY